VLILDTGRLARATRNVGPSLVVVATASAVSLLVLYLWRTTPSTTTSHDPGASGHAGHAMSSHDPGGSGHAGHAIETATAIRPVVFMVGWMLMTAAMMLPSAMPLLASLDRIARSQSSRRTLPLLAALAYLAVWGAVGAAALAVNALADAHLLSRASSEVVSLLGGGALVLAGVYGLSPLAGACLRACRRPFGFLARHWRGGSRPDLQAARIGAAYGVSCVGCCVPMVAMMFIVGMSNIAIVIAMGVVMVLMKSSVVGIRVAQLLSLALVVAGVAVALGWLDVAPHEHGWLDVAPHH
jgi:predicted metal-binding membrane protein